MLTHAQLSTSSGQLYYLVYELAPYRLACVAGGMAVAFFWTYFPYPITARSQLRKDLGASLYLLANFYSLVHTTIGTRIQGIEGDLTSKASPGRKLSKARNKVYAKQMALLGGLRQHSTFTAWEPIFGGKFPKTTYNAIIDEVKNIFNYLALISFAFNSLAHPNDGSDPNSDPSNPTWLADLARIVGTVQPTSQEITSTLSLLSASVTNRTPLPPYLKPPEACKLVGRLEALDKDILDVKHVLEKGYSAFAVMQIASSLVTDDLGRLIE